MDRVYDLQRSLKANEKKKKKQTDIFGTYNKVKDLEKSRLKGCNRRQGYLGREKVYYMTSSWE